EAGSNPNTVLLSNDLEAVGARARYRGAWRFVDGVCKWNQTAIRRDLMLLLSWQLRSKAKQAASKLLAFNGLAAPRTPIREIDHNLLNITNRERATQYDSSPLYGKCVI